MKRKFLFTILLFGSLPTFLFGQSSVNGQLVDKNEQPLGYFSVFLLNSDSVIVAKGITDSIGDFRINASPGKYIFQVKQLGSSLYERAVDMDEPKNMGRIIIDVKENLLDQVEVTAQKPLVERKVDRLVFNVDQAAASSGGNALDALRITPSVQLRESGVEIIGKSSARIMINERPVQLTGEALINYLASLKSDDIRSIEVISNPGARYDAEGTGGLINIVLKRSLPESWNASLLSSYTKATYGSGNYGGSFNFKKDRSAFSFNGSYNHGSIKRKERDKLFYPDQLWDTDFEKRLYTKSLSLRAAYDYELSENLSMGIEYLGSYNRPHGTEKDFGVLSNATSLQIDSLIDTEADNRRRQNSSSFNFHTTYKMDTLGKAVYLSADYFDYSSGVNRNFITQALTADYVPINGSLISTVNDGDQRIKNYSAKLDFDWPTDLVNLTFGTKFSGIKTENILEFYNLTSGGRELNVEQSNQFIYHENTQAVYFSGNKKFGSKWETQVGLRLENTQTRGNSVTYQQTNENDYVQLFPTFYVLYNPDKTNSFSAEYGRRINRPGYSSLNPFRFYSSPYNYTEGNPFLRPQFAHTFDFRYGYKHALYATISYLKEANGFGEVPFADESTKIQYFTQLNYFTYDKYTFSLSYVFDRLKWWINSSEAYVFYNRSSFNENVAYSPNAGWGTYLSTINTFNLDKSKNMRTGFYFFYQSAVPDLLFNNRSYWNMDLFFRYAMANKKLLLSFQVRDIFKTYKLRKSTSTNDVYQLYSSYNDNRSFRVSLSYNFGNNNIRSKSSRSGNNEERNRVD